MTTQAEGRTLEQVNARMEELRNGVLMQGPVAEGYNEAAIEYVALLEEHRTLTVQANESAITDAKSRIAEGIKALVESFSLADLKQEPITYVTWRAVTGDDGEVHYEVGVNPSAPASTKRRAPRKQSSGDGSVSEGRDLEAMFEAHATPEDKTKYDLIKEGYTSSGKDYVDPESDEGKKKTNSRLWALKNQVANRAEKEQETTTA